MATAFAPVPHAEDRSVLREISWETYIKLCDENRSRSTQMAYFKGELEIMTVGLRHELSKDRIGSLVGILAEALGVEYEGTGQHTFQHNRKRIGFEADLSFYVTNIDRVRGPERVNLETDPPPDLVVEVDISRNSVRKLLMYGALGIREVWRYEGGVMRIYRLSGREYRTAAKTSILPGVTAKRLTTLLAEAQNMSRLQWFSLVRQSVCPST